MTSVWRDINPDQLGCPSRVIKANYKGCHLLLSLAGNGLKQTRPISKGQRLQMAISSKDRSVPVISCPLCSASPANFARAIISVLFIPTPRHPCRLHIKIRRRNEADVRQNALSILAICEVDRAYQQQERAN